jgi:hypothetical protein
VISPASKAWAGAEHVEPPRSLALVSDRGDRFGLVRLQVGSPVPQRKRIVFAQRLDVADLEAGGVHGGNDFGDGVKLGAREDIP